MKDTNGSGVFGWIGRHGRLVLVTVLIGALALGTVGGLVADDAEPNFDPSGEVFELAERVDGTLQSDSTVWSAAFLVEAADGGDVLTAASFREWFTASEVVRSGDGGVHLVERFDSDLGVAVPGVFSIADAVDDELEGGLATATDADVKVALSRLLATDAPTAGLRFTLSERATDASGSWTSPAFTAQVVYDRDAFGDDEAAEEWLREVQATVRADAVETDPIGIAIDASLAFGEAAQESSPFIFLTVALIVLLIAIVHRSYWSSVVVATGLGATMLVYYGTASVVGLKMGSLLLAFIVPIATISFGVDFYIHGVGRVRERQMDGERDHHAAYASGMRAVFLAMLLAALSSVVAFVSNAVSGTEAIVEFGIGGAIAIGSAYVILGLVAPRALVAAEASVGRNPRHRWSKPLYWLGQMTVAVVAGLSVALAAVMPAIGTAAVAAMVVVIVLVPLGLTRRRNRRAAVRGRVVRAELRGAAHGLRPVGGLVAGLARFRILTIPVVLVIGALALGSAMRVESGFEVNDFLASDTDFSSSIERANDHFPTGGEGTSYVFVEGDLTDPRSLGAIDAAVASLDRSTAGFGRYPGGELIVGLTASDLVRMTMGSPEAVEQLAVRPTDVDGDGLPDTSAQVRAIYDHIGAWGVPAPDGGVALDVDQLGEVLYDDGGVGQATAIVVSVGSFTDGDVIRPVWNELDRAARDIEAGSTLQAGVSGEVISSFESLDAFTTSMLVALPLAAILTLLLAMFVLRSLRYAIAAVVPIGFVVVGVYAFMAAFGYTVNVVTATIAAIAVGVGIDFSTHFTARFREELASAPTRLAALRRTGQGTGGALVLSAATSVLGFSVMAMAPAPIFATFGVLTAVMIGLALLASLIVLPSVLMLVTPRRHDSEPAFALDDVVPEPATA